MVTEQSHKVIVLVDVIFLDEQSVPDESDYAWAYHVSIENAGHTTLQFKSCMVSTTNSYGMTDTVIGDGILEETVRLSPGDTFEYTDSLQLSTPSGLASGEYHVVTEGAQAVIIKIPPFSLDSPFDWSVTH